MKLELEFVKKENDMLHQILDRIHEGILATDEEGKILFFNPVVARNDGLTSNCVGKTEPEVYGDFALEPQNLATVRVVRNKKPVLDERFSYISVQGTRINLLYSCYPFYYEGQFAGTYQIGRDIHQIKQFIDETIAMEKQVISQNSREKGDAYYFLENIIGSSPQMKVCIDLAKKAAQYDMPVMIVGETGTGKELFAQGIHNAGRTARGKFISVNCAALPENLLESILFGTVKGAFTGAIDTDGLFEQAEDGTLFLDEVNSLPIVLQGKLLRALQEKRIRRVGGKKEIPVNCRIISASNVNLFEDHENSSNNMRMDLLYRLTAVTIQIPPLRERIEDIPDLCRYFIRKNIQNKNIFLREVSGKLLDTFMQYDWPGNVRELENMIWNSLLYTKPKDRFLMPEHVPVHLQQKIKHITSDELTLPARGLKESVNEYERTIIINAIIKHHENMSQAAKALKITRQDLYYKMDKLEISELFLK